MGTFGGHALPGSFFIVFAIWWTVQIYRRYFRSLEAGNRRPFRSSATFPFDFLPGRAKGWQWEGILKVIFTAIGFTGEIITAFKDGHFAHLGNGQHATMFFFFGLSGVVDIMVHHRFPLPLDIEYVIAALAFMVEDVLFLFHLHGRTQIDVLIHTLLVYVIHANVIVCLVEMKYRNNVVVALARSYVVCLQGTWFWQAGFILYSPLPGAVAWKPEDHDQMMVVTMMFAWHMSAIFVVMLAIGLVVSLVTRSSSSDGGASSRRGADARSKNECAYDKVRLMDVSDTEKGDDGFAHERITLVDGESDFSEDDDVISFQKSTVSP